jgi:hypothetical protein
MEDARPGDDARRDPARDRELDFEVDAMEALAEFEAEHRRILAMQNLYTRRRRAGDVA